MGANSIHQSNVSSLLINYESSLKRQQKLSPEIQIAFSENEKRKAYALAYEEYLKKGYINANQEKLLKDQNDLDEENVIVFNAFIENELAGTITVNTKSRLPFEETWPRRNLPIDLQWKKAAEITRFAVSSAHKQNNTLLTYLFVSSFLYARHFKSCQGLFIEVTPSHSKFYQNYISFEEIARANSCHRVKNTQAALLWLDFSEDKSKLNNSKVNLPETTRAYLISRMKDQFKNQEIENLLMAI